jgi:nuclear transport factor 2 (NTF2) superfamily protein
MDRPPLPPFTAETAAQKARFAEDAWNTRDPARVALAYTADSRWRNRSEFLQGRAAIEDFLTRKWKRELDYRLIKDVWAFRENRIAVRFAYEWHDDSGNWFRSYGNENWEFDEHGLMRVRIASINDLPITSGDRKYHWLLGRRPDDHPGHDRHVEPSARDPLLQIQAIEVRQRDVEDQATRRDDPRSMEEFLCRRRWRNSCADENVSTRQFSVWISASNDSRTETSSSTTNTMGMTCDMGNAVG